MLTTTNKRDPKAKKSTFRNVSEWLHLWLGLISGICVFIVCFTGGIWCWRYEVWGVTEKHWKVEPQQKSYLAPSVLIAKSREYLKTKNITEDTVSYIRYWKPGRSMLVSLKLPKKEHADIYLNPYDGKILKDLRERSAAEQFFIFIRAGHRFLWLKPATGSPIVGSACIIFVITLITGLIWWYPSKWTKKTVQNAFTLKWGAKWKRLNIDIHNVIGFYSILFVLALTLSGIFFTFEWFEKGTYNILTWKTLNLETGDPKSDTTVTVASTAHPEDVVWLKTLGKHDGKYGSVIINFPDQQAEPYESTVYFQDGNVLYNGDVKFYDQKTLKELPPTKQSDMPYESLSVGEKMFRMNFDIHTGQILGLPTKILAFFACMIGASMPITGFIIWYNRKWGKKKSRRKKRAKGGASPQLA